MGKVEQAIKEQLHLEDPDEYRAENIFWVATKVHWYHLQKNARQLTMGKLVDQAKTAIERYLDRGRADFEQDELLQVCFLRHL